MTKPRILMMVQLPPPRHGAAIVNERLVLSERLNAEFALDVLPVQLARSVEDSGKVSLGKGLNTLRNVVILAYRLIIRRPSIAFFTIPARGIAFVGGAVLLFVVKLFGVPHVLQMRSRGIAQTANLSRLHRRLCQWAFARAVVILYSSHVLSDVAPFVAPDRIFYLPDGIPDPQPQDLDGPKPDNELPRILFLSHLFQAKGPLVLLEALALLKKRGRQFRATYVGEPGDVSGTALKQQIQSLDLASEACYIGPKYGAEKELAFLSADIFAFPTFYPLEAFPGVLLEAMAYGLPIVTTNEAAIPDIVVDGRSGFVLPGRDSVALADALEVLVDDADLRQRMGRAAREDFCRRFLFSVYEDRLVEILRKVLSRSEVGVRGIG